MPRKKLLCVICGRPATHRAEDNLPYCEEHARLHPDAVPLADLPPGKVRRRARTVTEPQPEAEAQVSLPRGLLATLVSLIVAIVAGSVAAGVFYGVVGLLGGGGGPADTGAATIAGVAAVIVGVTAFFLMRKTMSDRFKRRS